LQLKAKTRAKAFFGSKILYQYPINAKINRLD
jgi:hypothetical protein